MVPSVGVDSRMAGRPSLRIGGHGKISRVHLGGGLWLARCRYRDTDGVTRKVQRLGPPESTTNTEKWLRMHSLKPWPTDVHRPARMPLASKRS